MQVDNLSSWVAAEHPFGPDYHGNRRSITGRVSPAVDHQRQVKKCSCSRCLSTLDSTSLEDHHIVVEKFGPTLWWPVDPTARPALSERRTYVVKTERRVQPDTDCMQTSWLWTVCQLYTAVISFILFFYLNVWVTIKISIKKFRKKKLDKFP